MANSTGPMPQTVAEVYSPLSEQLVGIHIRWTLYRQLFGTDPARIELLNRFAAVFFGSTQRVMEDELILALCRMSDPAETGRGRNARQNCTIERLVSVVVAEAPQTELVLRPLLATIQALRDEHLEELRNRSLAHNDFTTMQAMWAGQPGPPRPNRAQIESFLAPTRNLMNAVQKHYENAETYYGRFNVPPGRDGEALVYYFADLAKRIDTEERNG
jgi:hypothetical protein